uniref:ditrans,polycis-polyprenyl diphosphate synthase [(2E,6E)-farnesyldiphosphate specific] n=1 Tax=Rhizophora mucronata TaxID=61149 RepID=A0A2P2J8J2_RHIMU
MMDARYEVQRFPCCGNQIVNLGLRLLWHFLHLFVSLWYLGVGMVDGVESYLISCGILNRYKSFDVSKLNYLAIVMESEDARRISKVIQLLQWLEAIGVKHLCLYDVEGKGILLLLPCDGVTL